MNILFITSFRITPNSGGVQRVTSTLAKEFIKKGNNVYYMSFSRGVEEIIEGVNQYYLPNGKDFNNIQNIDYFKNILNKTEIDIIINQIGFILKDLKFIKDNITSKIKIITVHHNCLKCLNDQYHNIYISTLKSKRLDKIFNNKIGWYLLKKLHKFRFSNEIKETIYLSDKVVLLSDKFIPEVRFYLSNFDKNKVIGIPNPNPFSKNSLTAKTLTNNKENILLYVGRLETTQKRVERLIDIWERTYKQFTDWSFHIVGEGMMEKELREIVKLKKIERVIFHGFKDPRPLYKKAKIFCLTSDFEGYGMVLVEAQTYGVVPISNRSFTSIDDIIDNDKTGIIIDDFDLDEYIIVLHNLMKSPERLESMMSNTSFFIEKYNSGLIAEMWICEFNSLFENE